MGIRAVIYPFLIAIVALMAGCSSVAPSAQINSQSQAVMDHKKDFFVAHKGIEDGYEVIFHVMPAPEGLGYSQEEYHLMVSILRDNKPVKDLNVYSDVKQPDGIYEPRVEMMRMGEWYMARYNLSHETGRHLIRITFEVAGKRYFSRIHYPEDIINI